MLYAFLHIDLFTWSRYIKKASQKTSKKKKRLQSMERKGWSAKVVMRYALLQIPFTALVVVVLILMRKWVNLPIWFVCVLVALLVIKDIALYPLVWRAYDPDSPELTNRMEGARGIAIEDLHPTGYVEIGAERWQAEVTGNSPSIRRGQRVRVRGIRGLTLLVQLDMEN
jgi:membrane protein implicated in regulation of membrane protease activity